MLIFPELVTLTLKGETKEFNVDGSGSYRCKMF